MSTSADSVASTLASLGLTTPKETKKSNTGELGQADFLTLLTAQLKNQSPLNPSDPSQFASEIAQFSTVNGVQQLNSTMQDLSTSLVSNQTLQASSLVGRSVALSNNNTAVLDSINKVAIGTLVLDQDADNIQINVKDKTGTIIKTLSLGSEKAGNVNFGWDGTDANGQAVPIPGVYQITATGQVGNKTTALNVATASRINSITVGTSGAEMQLNLANGSQTSLNKVLQIF